MELWLQASWITTIGWGGSAECLLVRMDTLTETKSQSIMSDAVLTTNGLSDCRVLPGTFSPAQHWPPDDHSGYPAFTEKAGT